MTFLPRAELPVVGAVALGGMIGALLRYQAGLIWPTPPGGFPWTTVGINAIGSFAIGVVLVLVTEPRTDAPRLARPFLATGVLGGFTTFSAFTLDAANLARDGRLGAALGSVLVTAGAATVGVFLGIGGTRRTVGIWRRA